MSKIKFRTNKLRKHKEIFSMFDPLIYVPFSNSLGENSLSLVCKIKITLTITIPQDQFGAATLTITSFTRDSL